MPWNPDLHKRKKDDNSNNNDDNNNDNNSNYNGTWQALTGEK